MGRKVHPVGFRLGIIKDWTAKWYAEGERYADLLQEDLAIRQHVRQSMGRAGISDMTIERFPKQVRLSITTAKPGIIIGRKGANIKKLKDELEALTKKKFKIDVEEVKNPDIDAYLISHRRAMKQAIQRGMRAGAKGIRISIAGRLGGGDMARREDAQEGRVPRHTLRADIDYVKLEALTTYSKIGIKVWVYKGEVL